MNLPDNNQSKVSRQLMRATITKLAFADISKQYNLPRAVRRKMSRTIRNHSWIAWRTQDVIS